ncbi:DUF6503 family protein [Mariniflexile sp. AS56]|uniref:DUF6503 family protein n=1 Tax=Mariniflexile sp. AS56 TaxID=3063957 RepID=UPI0026EB1736|nr:DUF6503 family protein [Mariniflexile sp. AS56]MDO7170588.1 DUF6503 family protein [Mariniflexile sp. AS56]
MKYSILLLVVVSLVSCKDIKKEAVNTDEITEISARTYPENISKIFEAHGGLDTWNSLQSLAFTMEKPDGDEVTTTHLKNRKALIEMPKHTIGYNGKNVWLHSKDTTSYKGNPKFYYNLMFYFYSMPFVLSDAGITYEDTDPLLFEGKSYPGIKISYGAEVGESPDDEYILYYDSETGQMSWLAYTMTYFAKEKSKKFSYIKYNDWQDVNGVLLPKAIQWYNVVDGKVTDMRNEVLFTNVKGSTEKPKSSIFEMPDGGKIIE